MNIEKLKTQVPTWPGKSQDLRRKQNKAALKAARHTGHVRRSQFGANGFIGSRTAWEFSNELLAEMYP